MRTRLTGSAGFTGNGVTVAVIDSGIAIADDYCIERIAQTGRFRPETSRRQVWPRHSRRRHHHRRWFCVSRESSLWRQLRRCCPRASVLNLRVLDGNGAGQTSNVLAALDWCLQEQRSIQHPRHQPLPGSSRLRILQDRSALPGGRALRRERAWWWSWPPETTARTANGAPVYGGITSPGQ